ncbi:Predicted N-acetyltransferase YhbS [Halobacillus karajensis]|uniref:Acetyltransferase (GNAT) family protein n=1 Tax=Halobacillus karajensis TaxID=195088 RepID=A0A024P5G7_9BACI|nr:GNAT family N-acetyltransferase [Halobacillus karajensis]CDQ20421.1 Acetyltransferase (GNAT) family protein [Halobacillus karajensis]CDQ24110.1 Acetyltransferase (GNAT) family protein [Halobacillus karajensis]CDQ27588.1 Acetyltransferase (GNAT) family protein [Halobacillus karajensis]SEH91908.1 Predicted N-acetyltransferase YhbS [Halobacillus karajensis]
MKTIQIRTFLEKDFDTVQQLNEQQGWRTLVERGEETLCAWLNSEPALVAVADGEVIGFLRGLTDGSMTLYICELLVKESHRKQGIAENLIRTAHECYPGTRIEVLASQDSEGYYISQGYRPFYGFRKTVEEV